MNTLADDRTWPVYKRLLGYVRSYWWVFLISMVGYALYSAMQPLMADFVKFIEATLKDPQPDKVLILCLAPAGFVLVQGFGQFLGSYCISWIGQRLVHRMRTEVFSHLLSLPHSVYQKQAGGQLMSKIIFDAQQITSAGSDAITIILREGMVLIALFGYLLYSNWKLTLILFTVAPLVALIVSVTSKRFRNLSRRIQSSMGNITQYLGEAIEGSQVVKIFGGRAQEEQRFTKVSKRFERNNVKLVTAKIASTHLVQLAVACGVGVIIYLFIQLMGDDIGPGEFFSFIIAVSMTQKPLKQLTDVNVKIQRGVTGAVSLFEILDQHAEIDQGDLVVDRVRGDIEFRDVVFGYTPDKPVLRGISFHIHAGETVALVGRSGAGKTTISALLPRFFDPDAGEILLDGQPLRSYRLDSLRRQIAMVSQRVVLFNDSIRNNVAYGELQKFSEQHIEQALKDAHAWEFVSIMPAGINAQIGEDGAELSGGQRQRLAIARALLKDAPILILDEATSALDTESEFRIQQALDRVMHGRTTFVIAHRLSTVERADRILVMDQGRVVEAGSHQELLARNGFYTQLYRKNFED